MKVLTRSQWREQIPTGRTVGCVQSPLCQEKMKQSTMVSSYSRQTRLTNNETIAKSIRHLNGCTLTSDPPHPSCSIPEWGLRTTGVTTVWHFNNTNRVYGGPWQTHLIWGSLTRRGLRTTHWWGGLSEIWIEKDDPGCHDEIEDYHTIFFKDAIKNVITASLIDNETII